MKKGSTVTQAPRSSLRGLDVARTAGAHVQGTYNAHQPESKHAAREWRAGRRAVVRSSASDRHGGGGGLVVVVGGGGWAPQRAALSAATPPTYREVKEDAGAAGAD